MVQYIIMRKMVFIELFVKSFQESKNRPNKSSNNSDDSEASIDRLLASGIDVGRPEMDDSDSADRSNSLKKKNEVKEKSSQKKKNTQEISYDPSQV